LETTLATPTDGTGSLAVLASFVETVEISLVGQSVVCYCS
jgi:hypothetical protein